MNESWFHKAVRLVPPRIVGEAEYYLRPYLTERWGSAFNGQCFRQLMFIDLLQACRFEAVVETGTYYGTTTLFMARNSSLPVYSCELDSRKHAYSQRHLRHTPNVTLVREDSRSFLKGLTLSSEARVFFYLDAHWERDLPLLEETQFIFKSFKNYVVMIDDFEVPGDAGYSFDDYGLGKRLSLRDFPFDRDSQQAVFFPNRPSQTESGSRRGCVVLASPSLASSVAALPSLVKKI